MPDKISHRDLKKRPVGRGQVQVLTGNGKGKTTSALGSVVRAVGHGLRVSVIFFMKGDYPYGERKTLICFPDVSVKSFGGEEFVDPERLKPEQKEQASKALTAARSDMLSGNFDLVVLDEINVASAFNLITVDDVLQLIKDKPERVDLILTGRKADIKILDAADLVTEMVNIKHPYDRGFPARPGYDF